MSNSIDPDYREVWQSFTTSVQTVIKEKSKQSGRSHIKKYYLDFTNQTLAIISGERFTNEVVEYWMKSAKKTNSLDGAQLLLIEMKAYPNLVNSILESKSSKNKEEKKIYKWKDALRIAKTILESLIELLSLSEWGKIVFNFYLEGIDIFKG